MQDMHEAATMDHSLQQLAVALQEDKPARDGAAQRGGRSHHNPYEGARA
jgi:flagellum-specific ATP synthase